jgi:beta-phosphoglucomutase
MLTKIEAVIFDLDGVIVDTAKYHFLAWKELAMTLQIPFDEKDNDLLKGVSRTQSLEYILHKGNLQLSGLEKEKLATQKNLRYLEHITTIDDSEMLPGVLELLEDLKHNNIKIALGSASKNATFLLDRLHIMHYFDAVIDGNMTTEGKPNPETFLLAAKKLGCNPKNCLVIEDASKGVDAALAAGMYCLGLGEHENLHHAHWVIDDLKGITFLKIVEKIQSLHKKSIG